jgi:hypothetical protein
MSLFAGTAEIMRLGLPLLTNGNGVFTIGAVGHVEAMGLGQTVVIGANHQVGDTVIVLGDSGGGFNVQGDIPAGVLMVLGGNDYDVVNAVFNPVTGAQVTIDPGLTNALAKGDTFTFGPSTVPFTNSVEVNTSRYETRHENNSVDFGFQLSRQELATLPRVGWKVSRTSANGEVQKGKVVDVDTQGIIPIFWCGVA